MIRNCPKIKKIKKKNAKSRNMKHIYLHHFIIFFLQLMKLIFQNSHKFIINYINFAIYFVRLNARFKITAGSQHSRI